MSISIHDYLIDQGGIDWNKAVQEWVWLLPGEFAIWLVNRFGHLFIVVTDGSVHRLEVESGTLTKVAESRDDFCEQIDLDDNADDWLMISWVDQMVTAGMRLQPGQCYGFKIPPVVGGDYSVANCAPIAISDYLGAYGSIHNQLRDVPDGTEVVLKVTNLPKSAN